MTTLDELSSDLYTLLEALDDLENFQSKTILEPGSNYQQDNEASAQLANELLEQTIAQIEDKIDGYVYIIKQKTAQKEFYAEESKRLAHKAKTVENSINFLKSKLHNALSNRKLQGLSPKIQGKYYKASLATNGGRQPIKYELDQLPEEFKVRQEIVNVNQAKLNEALTENNGELKDKDGNVIAYFEERKSHLRFS